MHNVMSASLGIYGVGLWFAWKGFCLHRLRGVLEGFAFFFFFRVLAYLFMCFSFFFSFLFGGVQLLVSYFFSLSYSGVVLDLLFFLVEFFLWSRKFPRYYYFLLFVPEKFEAFELPIYSLPQSLSRKCGLRRRVQRDAGR